MDFRTDLALERNSLLGEESSNGIEKNVRESGNTVITEIKVTNEEAANAIGKPQGRYITAEVPPFSSDGELTDGRLDALIAELRSLLPETGTVLVAGLGNRAMTADALGPECADKIFATRHIGKELAAALGFENLRPVASLAPNVLGKTGIEAFEVIEGVAQKLKLSAIIAVDALAAMNINRLGSTVQLSDSGISPGSGIGNRRKEISQKTIGIPVIAVGVPTVISAYTVAQNIIDELHPDTDLSGARKYADFIVASREADLITQRASKLLALAINAALQPELSLQDILMLV